MFGNLINLSDLHFLLAAVRRRRVGRFLSALLGGRAGRVRRAWSHVNNPQGNWWDIPEVMERWNLLATGEPDKDYFGYFLEKHLPGRSSLGVLTLGCGTGQRELLLARSGRFSCIDAVDISSERIEHAMTVAEGDTCGGSINYLVGDVYSIELKEGRYDIVLAEQSLHHFSPLERILDRVNRFLKPDGFFFFNEFIGPARRQWTGEQLEAANTLLSKLPRRYRIYRGGRSVKKRIYRPSRLLMMLADPSEAAESPKILPLVGEMFDVIEVGYYGGAVLHLLFKDIAQNFLDGEAETKRLLRMCFEFEDRLMAEGGIGSDFAVGICRKRGGAE